MIVIILVTVIIRKDQPLIQNVVSCSLEESLIDAYHQMHFKAESRRLAYRIAHKHRWPLTG